MAHHPSLAVRYRPIDIDETGTDKPTRILLRSMLRRSALRVMVYGDSGAGKTALARVLEHAYYGGAGPAGSVHRINAHDDRTIGKQREDLYTFCRVHCPHKKLVVMDDAEHVAPALHQAIRCCIDEHGTRVMFICTCSQIQRVARGLRARMLTVRTRHLSREDLRALQDRVIDAEGMSVSAEARQYVLDASGPSARALLQHLGKLQLHGGEADLGLAQECCSSVHPRQLDAFTAACAREDGGYAAARKLYELFDTGRSVMDLLDAYFAHIKTSDIDDTERYPVIRLIGAAIKSFYDDQDDEIVLAVFARQMNILASSRRARNE